MDKAQLLVEIVKLNEDEPAPRSETIPFRVTPAEKAAINLAAELESLKASELIRVVIFKHIANMPEKA